MPLNRPKSKAAVALAGTLVLGMTLGGAITEGVAQMAAPTEHKGLKVETLGVIEEASLKSQVGLEGHIMLLRAITIEPGGHIAKHNHQKVPGLVKVISGEWIEGTESGERSFSADGKEGIVEDADTVNWFFNRGDEPATAIVCDIKPKA